MTTNLTAKSMMMTSTDMMKILMAGMTMKTFSMMTKMILIPATNLPERPAAEETVRKKQRQMMIMISTL